MPKALMCDERLLRKDLSGHTYLVTGANSGIGLATAHQLSRQGAYVIAACRDEHRAHDAFDTVGAMKGPIDIVECDLASLDSVRRFAETYRERYDRLDGLVNNAGLASRTRETTADGFELNIGVNHLGHFLLTELLLDQIIDSAPARIVCVSSVAHVGSADQPVTIDPDNLNCDGQDYSLMGAYGPSKLANVLHALELADRLDGTGVSAFSVHPGLVRTQFAAKLMPGWLHSVIDGVTAPLRGLMSYLSPWQGAQPTLHCLLDDDAPAHSGAYFAQAGPAAGHKVNKAGGWPLPSPNPHAHDLELARRLRDRSRELVGLSA